jgi:formylglycine-generating enzyme required for sulfatase activity
MPRVVAAFALANRLVTHGEWLAFMADGGYAHPRWWMSAGWDWVRQPAHHRAAILAPRGGGTGRRHR